MQPTIINNTAYRFFEELNEDRSSQGNIVAVVAEAFAPGVDAEGIWTNPSTGQREYALAFEGVFGYANTPTNTGSATLAYLTEHCVEVDEARARLVHPRVFAEKIDQDAPDASAASANS